MKLIFITLALLAIQANSLDNGQGITPPLGWNSYYAYGCNITDKVIKKAADLLVGTGLADAGYNYVIIDDCWQRIRDPTTGKIVVDLINFPSGIKSVVDYVHSKGLLVGIYSNANAQTCNNRPGSLGYEDIDAKTYADWGIDYLRYDLCNSDGSSSKARFTKMRDAILNTGAPIYYAIDTHGLESPHTWAAPVANSWRTADLKDSWESFLNALDAQYGKETVAKQGAWNDPGLLLAGNGGLKFNEYEAQFVLWAFLKAPMIIGSSLERLDKRTLDLLKNDNIIAITVDTAAGQGKRLKSVSKPTGNLETYSSKITNGFIIVLFNRSSNTENMSFKFKDVGFTVPGGNLHNLLTDEDLGYTYQEYAEDVPAHSVKVFKLHQMCMDEDEKPRLGQKGKLRESVFKFLSE